MKVYFSYCLYGNEIVKYIQVFIIIHELKNSILLSNCFKSVNFLYYRHSTIFCCPLTNRSDNETALDPTPLLSILEVPP